MDEQVSGITITSNIGQYYLRFVDWMVGSFWSSMLSDRTPVFSPFNSG
jgi:hypothetical protein